MGMKDKQMPSRCWERCSSPRRMRARLPATPALPALTPGAWGGPRQSRERCPLLLIPHRRGSHRDPETVVPHQPRALVSGPRQPPWGKTNERRGRQFGARLTGCPGGAWGFGPPPLAILAILWQRGQAATGSGNSADTATAQRSRAPAVG